MADNVTELIIKLSTASAFNGKIKINNSKILINLTPRLFSFGPNAPKHSPRFPVRSIFYQGNAADHFSHYVHTSFIIRSQQWCIISFISPDTVDIKSQITPEVRYRGIYEAILYNTTLSSEGPSCPSIVRSTSRDFRPNGKSCT